MRRDASGGRAALRGSRGWRAEAHCPRWMGAFARSAPNGVIGGNRRIAASYAESRPNAVGAKLVATASNGGETLGLAVSLAGGKRLAQRRKDAERGRDDTTRPWIARISRIRLGSYALLSVSSVKSVVLFF